MEVKMANNKRRDVSFRVDISGPPNYIIKKPEFTCPVSPHVAWHWGLSYSSCPIGPDQRDMGSCLNCKLRGDSTAKIKEKKRNNRSKKPKVKEPVPKINKTYVSK
jgi:hypothetical protein